MLIRAWTVLLLTAAALMLASSSSGRAGPWVESYVSEEEVYAVYGSPADEISIEAAGQLLLDLTNATRRENGLQELQWLEPAAAVAQNQANEMANQHYVNHYNLAGRKCELRFNLVGGMDQISENIAYYEILHQIHLTPQLVRRMHQHWLESDSHRTNMLNAHHTHFGAGFAVFNAADRTYTAGAAEFVADYGDYERLPEQLTSGAQVTFHGQLDPSLRFMYIGLGAEDLPFARDVEYQMTHIGGYSPPAVALALLPVRDSWSDFAEIPYRRYTVDYNRFTGEFTVPLEIEAHWPPATYYVTVWALDESQVEGGSFCTMSQVILVE
ncbi:CAP domain-containing protein [bacterium]|nr:CAP domain-containing protein [bacterium]